MSEIHYDTDQAVRTPEVVAQSPRMVRIVQKTGLAKTESEATRILLIAAAVCLIAAVGLFIHVIHRGSVKQLTQEELNQI